MELHRRAWNVLPIDMQREIANNRIYEALRSCGHTFIDNSICGLFSWEKNYVCTLTMNHKAQYEKSDKGFEHYMLFLDYNLDVVEEEFSCL